ncbi:MAG: MFS transporter [Chromatiales bacterium]|nr:MFS transporter [Chromatiales bacterium]
MSSNSLRLQLTVFALVAASFTNVYITQPVLPVLQHEFGAAPATVSYSVAAVILGIALANLPFGAAVDRYPIRPIILLGSLAVATANVICATTDNLWVLISARFVQGLFIPAMTTCVAAYLSKTLPAERLNVIMGSYISATVLGGLGGRLLGGWIHPPLHWRYAFISAAVLILISSIVALKTLPKKTIQPSQSHEHGGYLRLLKRWELVRIYLTASGSFFIFSSVFNFLPFKLSADPFNFPTELITLLYTTYIMGIFLGPVSGRFSNRFGNGPILLIGTGLLALALVLVSLPSLVSVIAGLLILCTGFFSVHAAAVGSLNRKVNSGQGRANALYVLFYYLGGWIGISICGLMLQQFQWQGVVLTCAVLLPVLLSAGFSELRHKNS